MLAGTALFAGLSWLTGWAQTSVDLEKLRARAEQADVDAQNQLGSAYNEGKAGLKQDYAEALKWFRQAADKGYAPALYNLGLAYDLGHGVPADDPEIALTALMFFPGIEGFRGGATPESSLRTADLRANAARASLARSGAAEDYFAALGMELSFRLNAPTELERVAELSAKTNQFNLTLARLTTAEIRKLATQPGGFVLAVALRDRLSPTMSRGW